MSHVQHSCQHSCHMTHHPYESFHSSAQPQGLYLTQNSNKQQGAVLKCLPDFFANGQEAPIQQ